MQMRHRLIDETKRGDPATLAVADAIPCGDDDLGAST
jgi:hypothetical protein